MQLSPSEAQLSPSEAQLSASEAQLSASEAQMAIAKVSHCFKMLLCKCIFTSKKGDLQIETK
nr:hypothetical protein [Nostoc sp. EkiNYC01]